MQCDGVVLSVLNPNTVSVLVLILFVIDEDENLFYAGVLTWSKAQADGVGFPSPNLQHTRTLIRMYLHISTHKKTYRYVKTKQQRIVISTRIRSNRCVYLL